MCRRPGEGRGPGLLQVFGSDRFLDSGLRRNDEVLDLFSVPLGKFFCSFDAAIS